MYFDLGIGGKHNWTIGRVNKNAPMFWGISMSIHPRPRNKQGRGQLLQLVRYLDASTFDDRIRVYNALKEHIPQ